MIFRMLGGGLDLSSAVAYIISSLAVIFITMPIHECAHGFVADKLGDKTARYQGRLTLSPFAHIDYFGAICILLFGFGWARPVQINPRNFKNPKWGMALSALAGPVANILLAIVCVFISNVLNLIVPSLIIVISIFIYIAQLNIYLAVFNILPIPPLDGAKVLFVFLPQKYYFSLMRYERYIILAVIVLLNTPVIRVPLDYLFGGVASFVDFVAALPFRLFM